MQTVQLPPGWEHQAAPAATLLDGLGSPWWYWGTGTACLVAALLLTSRRPRWSVLFAVTAAVCLGVACNGLVDDAYIQFRYAANLAAGHGPVFNPGERIEGASGGAWIGALAAGSAATGTDPARAGRVLSLVLSALAVLAAARCGREIGGDRAAAVAASIWAALPTANLYAATGLETAGFALALWITGAGVVAGNATAAAFASAAVAALRPEGVLLALAAAPFVRRLGRAGRWAVAGALASSAVMAAARWSFYGQPVPRSAIVKGITGAAGPLAGAQYLGGCLLEWWPLLLAAPFLVRAGRRALPALVPAAVWTLAVIARGGDWMPGGRYLLPIAVILVAATAAAAAHESRPARATLYAGVVWGLVLVAPFEPPTPLPFGRSWRAMAEHRVQSRWWEGLGTWLKSSAPAGTLLAAGPVGAIPYASGLRTFDLYGLCSIVEHGREHGEAGHRLWGLREAVDAGAGAVYPGQGLPQSGPWLDTLTAARSHVAAVPDFESSHLLVLVVHAPEYHSDVLRDVVWIRSDARPPAPAAPAR